MSDHYIALVPEDPRFLPDVQKQQRLRDRFAEIAPDSELIKLEVCSNFQLFDCGMYLDRIFCPRCGVQLEEDWWCSRLKEDEAGNDVKDGYKLAVFAAPCCGSECNLNELRYDSPQRFGRFALLAMNPNIGDLADQYKLELEEILGTKLVIIYRVL